MKKIFYPVLLFLVLAGCQQKPGKDKNKTEGTISKPSLQKQFYGMVGNDSVFQYTLSNSKGMIVKVLNYGTTITNIMVPDKKGEMGDVVLGFDSLNGYLQKDNPYFGCVAGRYANRIGNAKFNVNGKTCHLAANDNGNTLHGGLKGFDKMIWKVRGNEVGSNFVTLGMQYLSKNNEEGFPGNLEVTVAYSLDDENELKIYYIATTDQPTPVNLTNHSYFNLSAGSDSTILDHVLMLKANRYTEVNDKLIPTGKLRNVKGSPMDFTSPKHIGDDLAKVRGGFDHNWVLNKKMDSLELIGFLYHQPSGRYMEIYTTQPGIQFYAGNFLNGTLRGKNGKHYVKYGGLALETQHFPDSPNQPSFPTTVLNPGEVYHQTTMYKFSVK